MNEYLEFDAVLCWVDVIVLLTGISNKEHCGDEVSFTALVVFDVLQGSAGESDVLGVHVTVWSDCTEVCTVWCDSSNFSL